MARRPLVEFILQVINTIFILCGLGILGYGLVCLVQWKQNPPKGIHKNNPKFMVAHGHRLLLAVDLPKFLDSLPKAWFMYLLIGIGLILFIISCCGYVGAASRSPCCLLSYCVFMVLITIAELGTASFILFAHNRKEVILKDKSGNFLSVYYFFNGHWKVIRWIALGVLILQVTGMVLALYLGSILKRGWYDESDEDERIMPLPRVRPSNYRIITVYSTPSTTTKPRKLH